MCGEKQSIKRHYGIGNSKECRLHVQKLNTLRGEIEDEKLNSVNSDDNNSNSEENIEKNIVKNEIRTKSKWSTYIENEAEQVNEPMYLGNNEVCLEIPSKHTKAFKRKKVIPTNKENMISFRAPYKCESENTTMAFTQKLVESVNSVDDKSNTVISNETIHSYKTVSSYIEKSFEKPKVHKNSKWAQFVESDDFAENECQNTSTDTKKLFQLCADTDLDDVLNI